MFLTQFIPKGFFRYAIMPDIIGRTKTLTFSGFHYVPYLLALVYQLVRLLPADHPYLDPRNIGRYGVRHVVAQAANNLSFKVKNIDQIVLFLIVLAGIVLFFAQLFVVLSFLFFQPAMALPNTWTGFFSITNVAQRRQDLANIMLDIVFGVPHPSLAATGFFESCVGMVDTCLTLSGNILPDFDVSGAGMTLPAGDANQLGPFSSDAL